MPMTIQHIFLDMDGVLTDFIGAALRVHNRDDALLNWPRGERDVPKVLGISRNQYWKKIDALGSDFWANLAPYPWFDELIEMVREIALFTILTTSSLAPSCLDGKVRWLYEKFPKVDRRRFREFIIGEQKHLLAQPGRLLIDDAEPNVDAFAAHGGRSILFPQAWNRNHQIADPIEYTRSLLFD